MTSTSAQSTDATFVEMVHAMISVESKRGYASPLRWALKGQGFTVEKKDPNLNIIARKWFQRPWTSLERLMYAHGFKKPNGVYQLHGFHMNSKKENLKKLASRTSPKRPKEKASKLGTKKRKVKRRNSEASECSALLREATTAGTQEKVYGSDESTCDDTFAEELDEYANHQNAQDNPVTKPPAAKVSVPQTANNIRRTDTDEPEEEPANSSTSSNKIKLPISLKKILINTWESMSQKHLVYDLPSCMSVRKVLGMYVDAKGYQATHSFRNLRHDAEDQDKLMKRRAGWKNLADGIAMFFEKSVRTRLLYPQEIPQLNAQLASVKSGDQDTSPALVDFYGVEHLLRLLLILPDILAECMSDENAKVVLQNVFELVKFLHRQQDYLFVTAFRHLTEEEAKELGQNNN
ncbi:modification-related protein EAF3 [Seminavis robusta]|uniref:Modification-related protein EAF3 n=1 Tax=Seminavis robusta TaxID=568900 RepID=A0A9N8DTH1_9STRA|nr:modification-related protein EAF3 [Seminavis robusta]|eukprot:Sro345_g122440.1 modification-related protein EAF3 (406) ;mRNA; f:30653-32080